MGAITTTVRPAFPNSRLDSLNNNNNNNNGNLNHNHHHHHHHHVQQQQQQLPTNVQANVSQQQQLQQQQLRYPQRASVYENGVNMVTSSGSADSTLGSGTGTGTGTGGIGTGMISGNVRPEVNVDREQFQQRVHSPALLYPNGDEINSRLPNLADLRTHHLPTSMSSSVIERTSPSASLASPLPSVPSATVSTSTATRLAITTGLRTGPSSPSLMLMMTGQSSAAIADGNSGSSTSSSSSSSSNSGTSNSGSNVDSSSLLMADPFVNEDDDWWSNAIEEDTFTSPLAFDASENGLWNGRFVPPPPRPPFLDESVAADGLTTCDLCTWAWQKNAYSLDGSIGK